jgi:hypothetical protein
MFYQPDLELVITGTGNQVARHLLLAAIANTFASRSREYIGHRKME